MADPVLERVPLGALARIWYGHGVEDLVAGAERYSHGHWTAPTLYRRLERGEAVLWIGHEDNNIDLVLIMDVSAYESGHRTCDIILAVGSRLSEYHAQMEKIAEWARSEGCVEITATGRRGIDRLAPDFEPVATVYRKSL